MSPKRHTLSSLVFASICLSKSLLIKSLYNYYYSKENLLFNNQDILIDGKPFFLEEWFSKGVVSVNNLFHESGRYLTFQEFLWKYNCKSNFLEYYQVLSGRDG